MLAFARCFVIASLALAATSPASALAEEPAALAETSPERAGLAAAPLATIDEVVAQAIEAGEAPGCVVLIGFRGEIVFLKAYGRREVEPEPIEMTTDAVFDLASLTKPIATATSVMRLVERGRVKLDDPVAKHLPDFGQAGKDEITVEQLLVHQSGLIPDNPLDDYRHGVDEAWRRIHRLKPTAPPGTKFVYSDVNFIALGKLVETASGQPLDEFARDEIFLPLEMRETGYRPGDELKRRAAPTERRDGAWLKGEVHDPRAALLGGVAGHAGLFSTARDLAIFAEAMTRRGRRGEFALLEENIWSEMIRARELDGQRRALGWDVQSGFSSNRGRTFGPRSFGHGGFTGTALWIDPDRELFVIFLSNRLHPDGKGSVNPLAGRIGTLAAEAVDAAPKK